MKSARFWRRRLAQIAFVVIGIAIVNFFLLNLAPGDAAQVIAGESSSATPEYMAALRKQFGLDQPLPVARHLVLPSVTLGLFYLAIYTRLMRAAMLDAAGQDFVRTATAKGVRPWRIAWRHIFRNALLPVVTMLGVQIGSVLGGAILVETVFAWPGLGRLAFEALFQRDLNLLLGILFCSSIVVVAVNLAIDLVYTRIDPRIELE